MLLVDERSMPYTLLDASNRLETAYKHSFHENHVFVDVDRVFCWISLLFRSPKSFTSLLERNPKAKSMKTRHKVRWMSSRAD